MNAPSLTLSRPRPGLAALLALATLAGCGGGGGEGGSTAIGGGASSPPTSGIQGSGIASGPISGFGSIIVNGVRYSTASSQIFIEGQSAQESQLRVGQVVTVRGRVNADGRTGTADEVRYNDNVEGPVASIDRAAGTLVVLGQTVRVTGSTLFDDFSPATLDAVTVGTIVEVSGLVDAGGVIVAKRIEREAPGGTFEVNGTLSALDTTASTFRINALTVSYAGVTPVDGPLANGQLVEVKGTLGAGGVFRASRVEVERRLSGTSGVNADIDGYVTAFVSNADFSVGNVRVITDASTQFVLNGARLGLNVEVEVEGTFNAAGALVARRVEIEIDNPLRVTGTVESIDAAANSMRVLGVTVTLDTATRFEDKAPTRLRPFAFGDLRIGDYVQVRGVEGTPASRLRATIVERLTPSPDVELQGFARAVADPNLTILGVSANLSTVTEFEDLLDRPITRAQFFAAAPDQLVELEGVTSGGVTRWEEASLED